VLLEVVDDVLEEVLLEVVDDVLEELLDVEVCRISKQRKIPLLPCRSRLSALNPSGHSNSFSSHTLPAKAQQVPVMARSRVFESKSMKFIPDGHSTGTDTVDADTSFVKTSTIKSKAQ
jgi:hypothetical protein